MRAHRSQAGVMLIEALIGEQVVGHGVGRSKQAASQAAAQDALDHLQSGLEIHLPETSSSSPAE